MVSPTTPPKRRSRSTRRAAALVLATSTLSGLVGTVPATAQPNAPENASEATEKLSDLSRKAEELTEKFKKAQEDHARHQADLDRANADAQRAKQAVAAAQQREEQYRQQVDQFTRASYKGARLNTLSAALTTDAPEAFLNRATTLDRLAQQNNRAVTELADATHQAERAHQQVARARDRAAKAERKSDQTELELGMRKQGMDDRIAEVREQYDQLSAQEQEAWSGAGSDTGPISGSGSATDAVNAALSKQGTPYVWGAKGPDNFDCSGLVQWSYEQAGVSVPASTQSQVSMGSSVSESEMKPGDVVFYYSSASHNGIYIGDGQVVHAPTEGQDVKVEDYDVIGDINSIRRVVE